MDKVRLGNTGVEVSALCLGTDHYGSGTDAGRAFQLLDQYFEAGGSFVDTANVYAAWIPGFEGGESETTVGRWMQERRNRDSIFIATKLGAPYQDTEGGLRAGEIERECETSLKRLGTDTIDLYYAHFDDRNTPLEETLQAFDRLVQAGKVRFIGASNHASWRLAEARCISQANGWAQYCAIEQRHTYLRLKPGSSFPYHVCVDDTLLDYCRVHGIALLAYRILLQGAYTRSDRTIPEQYLGPDSDARLIVLDAVARKVEATPNQVIIAWMRQSNPPILPIIGGSTAAQLSENLDALEIQLTDEQMNHLNAASAGVEAA